MERRQIGFRLKTPLCPERDNDVAVRPFDGDAGVEGQPAVAKGRAFREYDGPPVVGVGVQAPQAAARRGHLGADGDDAAHVVHVRDFGEPELVGSPIISGAVFFDCGCVSEQAQRRMQAGRRSLDAVPRNAVADCRRQLFRGGGRIAEIHMKLPRQLLKFRQAEFLQAASCCRQPGEGGEHAGGVASVQPCVEQQIGDGQRRSEQYAVQSPCRRGDGRIFGNG